MPTIISGSTGISGTDGTAATPAVQGTDTNTGIFFPAADTIAFAEGGAEVMRIDSAGNVGIGTASPTARLTLAGTNNSGTLYATDLNNTPDVAGNGVGLRFLQAGNLTNYIRSLFASGEWGLTFGGTLDVARVTNSGSFQFNSGYGSVATAFGCRAWVNFNGTGTVAIRSSGNISSITDNGIGNYTVNFTNAMPDANYSVGGACSRTFTTDLNRAMSVALVNLLSGSVNIVCGYVGNGSSGSDDPPTVNVQIFR